LYIYRNKISGNMKSNVDNIEFNNNAILEILNKKLNAKKYQKSRLLFRTERTILKLEKIVAAISLIKKKNVDLSNAINAIDDGELKDQLKIQKIKAEYKLFLLQVRKNKVNVTKIILNQSKLNELEVIVLNLITTITNIESQLFDKEHDLQLKTVENDNSFQKNNPIDNDQSIISINLLPKILKINKPSANSYLKLVS